MSNARAPLGTISRRTHTSASECIRRSERNSRSAQFSGSLANVRLARHALNNLLSCPVVFLKDFVLDEHQLIQARPLGADSVLLMVATPWTYVVRAGKVAPSPSALLRELFGLVRPLFLHTERRIYHRLSSVKICGNRNAEEALANAEAAWLQ
ncbi:hypothetical protein PENSPDRAFT_671814 [Peniophora sp. CONT]|nr:hypothetical protein PENSPDRAFT_671814 [Peniophora sp. CONT]